MSRPSLASPEPHDVAGSTQPHLPTACLLHPFARSTLINKAGLLTGGSSPQERARASKWNQKEHEGLKSEQEALRRELESLPPAGSSEEREMALRHQIASRQQEVQAAGADFELTKQKLAKAKSELSTLTSSLATAEKGLAEAEAKLAKGEAEVRALQDKCDAKEDEIFSSFSRALGIASVREYEEKTLRAARASARRSCCSCASSTRSSTRSCSSSGARTCPPRPTSCARRLRRTPRPSARRPRRWRRMAEKADSLKTQVAAAEAEAKESKQAQETATSELKALKKKLRDAMERMGGAKQRLQQTETELEQQRGTGFGCSKRRAPGERDAPPGRRSERRRATRHRQGRGEGGGRQGGGGGREGGERRGRQPRPTRRPTTKRPGEGAAEGAKVEAQAVLRWRQRLGGGAAAVWAQGNVGPHGQRDLLAGRPRRHRNSQRRDRRRRRRRPDGRHRRRLLLGAQRRRRRLLLLGGCGVADDRAPRLLVADGRGTRWRRGVGRDGAAGGDRRRDT